ncbi:PREDICTED: uncharacterized protein LOC108567363 [Nicrophorus vespilloides]|uniref:Uncharacterized protein LOC108567363 n=1 Tax=Nicrophorus vespilloides TaxID=110193 RepID=A0ABM1N8W8_NICVS|nr:PREDICTED: uncharacterized protein LOC108567363 [Nicrophorus vespilloides]
MSESEGDDGSLYSRKRARLDTSQSRTDSPSLFSDISSISFDTSGLRSSTSTTSSVAIERLPLPAIKIKKIGKDATRFKPINRDRMYWKVVNNPNSLQPIINEWVYEYQFDGNALFAILQFIIDIMGYQSFDVKEALTDWENLHEINGQLEEWSSLQQKDFQCVLINKTTYCKSVSKTYFNFIYYLMKTCSSCNIVYDHYFLDRLLKILIVMSKSMVRVVRHTAVITVVKLCTELISIMQDIDKDEEKQAYLHTKINSCLNVYYMNCGLSDAKMSYMRTSCLNECNKWIHLAPNLMANKKSLTVLRRMLLDIQPVIRIAALTTIKCLMPNLLRDQFEEQELILSRLMKEVENRLVDVNQVVVEQAILVIYEHTKELCVEHSSDIRNYIFKCIYVENRNIARAAGNYLYYLLSEALPEEFLKKIVLFDSARDKSTALFVDALIDTAREFQDFDFILEYLYDNNGEFSQYEENKLIKMFYYAAKYMLTGEFSGIPNNRKTEAAKFAANYQQFIEHFQPKINSFIDKYKSSNEGLKFLLQTILLIDFCRTEFSRGVSHI